VAGGDRDGDRQAIEPEGALRGYPFEVALPPGLPIAGVVLADQVRNLDWKVRRAEVAAAVPLDVVTATLGKLTTLLT
jgi:mRNA interferase MazF